MEMGYLGGVEARAKEKNNKWRNLKKRIGAEGTIIERKKEEKGFKICWEFKAILRYKKVRPLRELYTSRSV
jgi:hypothetical protein